MSTVLIENWQAPPVDRREILRYAGVRGEAPEVVPLLERCLQEALPTLDYRLCYCELPIVRQAPLLEFGTLRTASKTAASCLEGCTRVIVLGATVGMGIDRLIARGGATSPAKGLLYQAIGAERVEALCDAFVRRLATQKVAEGQCLRPRFSPGYGDFSIEAQRAIFAMLDPAAKIGLSLNESLLMSPTKSVTALIGIADRP